jgi:hypothetical protein
VATEEADIFQDGEESVEHIVSFSLIGAQVCCDMARDASNTPSHELCATELSEIIHPV